MTRFNELWERFLSDSLSGEDARQLQELLEQDEQDEQQVPDAIEQMLRDKELKGLAPAEREGILLQRILAGASKSQPAIIRHFRFSWKWAAAAVFFTLVIGSYFFFFNSPAKQIEIVKKAETVHDVKAPSVNRAMITLANGQKVYLDSVAKGELAVQGNARLVKLDDGEVAYNGNAQSGNEIIYNTISNPRGSRVISITLADGTRVWLNAESSLRYPAEFTGTERMVEITGEGYFEVAHNAAMPFTVKKGNTEVRVLGTHFNVNAYDDESTLKITLLEGAIRVKANREEDVLKPGQQALVDHEGLKIKIMSNVDLDEVMAWRNGLFRFDNADLKTVMRQLERWYDVEVQYEGRIDMDQQFEGELQRSLKLSDVLFILEKSRVHFRIEDRKLIVMP